MNSTRIVCVMKILLTAPGGIRGADGGKGHVMNTTCFDLVRVLKPEPSRRALIEMALSPNSPTNYSSRVFPREYSGGKGSSAHEVWVGKWLPRMRGAGRAWQPTGGFHLRNGGAQRMT